MLMSSAVHEAAITRIELNLKYYFASWATREFIVMATAGICLELIIAIGIFFTEAIYKYQKMNTKS